MARDMTDLSDKWCILRTSGSRTLKLAASLAAAGIHAWSPAKLVAKNGRAKAAGSQKRAAVSAPIIPTFVFVKAAHVPHLRECLAMPINPHPGFSIFHYLGRIPMLRDGDLTSLRAEEERALLVVKKRTRRSISVGTKVAPSEGAWAGMTGIVESTTKNGKDVLVNFGGTRPVKIAAWLLPNGDVDTGLSADVVAAHMA